MSEGMFVGGIAADPNMPKIGQRVVGRYDIVRLLGQGGFAAVYEAVDTRASGRIAIKILHAEKSFDESFANRFRQEVMLVRQLQHPNTIKITDAGTTETGCLFMVMEYIQGKELHKVMTESGPMAPDRVIRIAEQILKALAEAHEKGIVHRDLKPQNIMIGRVGGEDDYVKVLDFGIAKALEPDMQQVQTQAGMVFCTPKYAAPEILMARGVKPAADVYALGLIMAEMLMGRPVIDAPSEAETIAMALSPEPVPIPPDIANTALGRVIMRALAKPLNERYQSALQMLQDLRATTSGTGVHHITPSGFPSSTYGAVQPAAGAATLHLQQQTAAVAAPEKSGSRTGLILLLVFLALAVVGGGVFAFMQMNKNQGGGSETTETPDTGSNQVVATPEPDVVEEPAEPEEPVEGPWMGSVSQPYVGERAAAAGPIAELSALRLLDESALLNQQALAMLQQAILSNQIPTANREEAKREYIQVLHNLVQIMTELNLCDAAGRRIERAFATTAMIPADGAQAIAQIRSLIEPCRSRVDASRPGWDAREFQEALRQAMDLYNTAQAMPESQLDQRHPRIFESLGHQARATAMVVDALENDRLRRNVDDARAELLNLYRIAVLSNLNLDLRISAEAALEEWLDHIELLPDAALQEAQELQLQVANENRTYFEEHGLLDAVDENAPWTWSRYQTVIQLAERAYSVTRAAVVPAPGEQPAAPTEQAPPTEPAEPSEGG